MMASSTFVLLKTLIPYMSQLCLPKRLDASKTIASVAIAIFTPSKPHTLEEYFSSCSDKSVSRLFIINKSVAGVDTARAQMAALIPAFMPCVKPTKASTIALIIHDIGANILTSLLLGSVLQLISIKFVGKSVLTLVLIIGFSSSKIPLEIICESILFAIFSRQYLSPSLMMKSKLSITLTTICSLPSWEAKRVKALTIPINEPLSSHKLLFAKKPIVCASMKMFSIATGRSQLRPFLKLKA